MRVYDLFHGPDGPTVQSNVYPLYSKLITKVAADSANEALKLARMGRWSDGKKPGIIATADGHHWDRGWRLYDGTSTHGEPWKHRQTFRPK